MPTPTRHLRLAVPFAVTVALLCSPVSAAAAIIFDNFGPGDAFSASSSRSATGVNRGNSPADQDQARSFVVPFGQDFRLDSLELALGRRGGPDVIDLWLAEDDPAGSPFGAPSEAGVLESFRLAGATDGGGPRVVAFGSAARPLLHAGSRYWVVLSVPGPDTDVPWMTALAGLSPQPVLIAERYDLGAWQVSQIEGGQGSAFRVSATAVAVPEPPAWLLLACGALAGCRWRRRARGRGAA